MATRAEELWRRTYSSWSTRASSEMGGAGLSRNDTGRNERCPLLGVGVAVGTVDKVLGKTFAECSGELWRDKNNVVVLAMVMSKYTPNRDGQLTS